MFLVMNDGDATLRAVAAELSHRDLPRVGWPTTVVPPAGVRVRARERGSALTITVTGADAEAFARLDLQTREVVVDAFGGSTDVQRNLRRIALTYADDRSAFDERCGINVHPGFPDFEQEDLNSWTPMQYLAYSTIGYWYPPLPRRNDVDGWLQFIAASDRFNAELRALSDVAKAPRQVPPRDEQSSAGPATPDLPGPAGA
jgi:hypothetical protein